MAWREKSLAVLVAVAALATEGCTGFGTNCSTDADCQAQNPQAICDPTLKVCFLSAGPVVTIIEPADMTLGVTAANAQVAATFSEPVVDAGVTFDSFMVIGQGFRTPGMYSLSSGATQAIFQPYGGTLALGTNYTVNLTASIKDEAGNALRPFTSAFSTRDGAWQGGSGGTFRPGPNVGNFSVASNYTANVVTAVDVALDDAISLQDFGLSAGVSANGGPPTAPNTPNLQSSPGQEVTFPSAGSAFDGTGFVVWMTQSSDAGAPAAYVALAAVFDPGAGTWGSPFVLEDAGSNQPSPLVTGTTIGTGLAVWLHTNSSSKQEVWADYYSSGGWLGSGAIQTDPTLNSSNLSVAGSAIGAAVLAWQSQQATPDGGPPQIVADYLPGPTIPIPQAISAPGLTSLLPYSAIGISNHGAVVWMAGAAPTDGGTIAFHIYSSTVDPAQTPVFGNAVQIDAAPGTAEFPQVGVAANGNAVAIWQEFSTTAGSAVVSSVYTYATKTWSQPVALDSSNSIGVYGPAVAVDPGGNALAAWFEGTEAAHQVFGGRYTPDAGWHDVAQLTTGSDTVENLQLQLIVDGFGQGWEVHERFTAGGQSYVEFIPFQ
jgi:hypothetical protein